MDLENKERILLLKLVREDIRKGQNTDPSKWIKRPFSTGYFKPRNQYEIAKMTTLYGLELKLKS